MLSKKKAGGHQAHLLSYNNVSVFINFFIFLQIVVIYICKIREKLLSLQPQTHAGVSV